MAQTDTAPFFPQSVIFPDVDDATLAREDEVLSSDRLDQAGAWSDYLRKVLPPIARSAHQLQIVRSAHQHRPRGHQLRAVAF